jgi:hypothetical protein
MFEMTIAITRNRKGCVTFIIMFRRLLSNYCVSIPFINPRVVTCDKTLLYDLIVRFSKSQIIYFIYWPLWKIQWMLHLLVPRIHTLYYITTLSHIQTNKIVGVQSRNKCSLWNVERKEWPHTPTPPTPPTPSFFKKLIFYQQ